MKRCLPHMKIGDFIGFHDFLTEVQPERLNLSEYRLVGAAERTVFYERMRKKNVK